VSKAIYGYRYLLSLSLCEDGEKMNSSQRTVDREERGVVSFVLLILLPHADHLGASRGLGRVLPVN